MVPERKEDRRLPNFRNSDEDHLVPKASDPKLVFFTLVLLCTFLYSRDLMAMPSINGIRGTLMYFVKLQERREPIQKQPQIYNTSTIFLHIMGVDMTAKQRYK